MGGFMEHDNMHTSPVLKIIANCTVAALSCLSMATAAAADQGKLLQGKAVTESNVLDALTPAPVDVPSGDADVSVRTRSLRVTPTDNSPSAQVLAAPRKKASASLLITFETNSAALTQQSKEQLDVVAAALKNDRLKDFRFEVQGHADSRGAANVNMTLSQQRAESVRVYLIGSHQIAQARLLAVGKGDAEPMNTRDATAAENRRVTITTLTQ